MTTTGYDPRRSIFELENVMPTTREKEKQRDQYRTGLVKRYENRKKKEKQKK